MKASTLSACLTVAVSLVLAAQNRASIDEALQQLQAGDSFRAVLTLNDVVAQNPGDPRTIARAHALRAMAFLAQSQPERAQAAVALALKADASFVPSAAEVNAATIALFAATSGAGAANPEADGLSAERAGAYQQAFLSYLAAYRALPQAAPGADDWRLRERIIRVVQKLPRPPAIPANAQEHARKADQLLEAEAVLGGTAGASSDAAAEELTQALRIAPWWPDATLELAMVQQKLRRVDEALANLNLYKLADPAGYGAALAATSGTAAVPPVASARAPEPPKPASITVYRRPAYSARAAHIDIDCNGQRIADLSNGRFVTFTAPAGKVRLKFEGDKEIVVTVAAGGDYYFVARPGAMNFNTEPATAAEAKALMNEKHAEPNEPARIKTRECKD